MSPRRRGVDGFPVGLQPRPHLPQPFFKNGNDCSLLRGADVDEDVAATADGRHEQRHDLFRRQDFAQLDVAPDAPRVRVDGHRVLPLVLDQHA